MAKQPVDPKEDFYSAIDINNCKIKLRPSTILIFGGKIDITKKETLSVREKIIEHTKANCPELHSILVVPEEYKDWASEANYSDLLEFETHIAQMCNKIIIIPESPGSIAELGAFVVNKQVKNKLMVILPSEHFNATSFIKQGLLVQLDDKQTFAYNYPAENFSANIDQCIDDIVFAINEQSKSGDDTENYDTKNFGHLAYCIFQIIRDCLALRLAEIETLLKFIDIKCEIFEIKRAIYLLQKLRFISLQREGNTSFYTIAHHRADEARVSYSGKVGKHIDLLSFKLALANFYKDSGCQRLRRRAIENSRKGGEQ